MTSTNNKQLHIGLLGCANIAKKNALAILQASSGCRITAIASRSPEKAEAFLRDFLVPRQQPQQEQSASNDDSVACLGGSSAYDDIIQASAVDALYIPLPTTLHKEWVIKALKAGKHVLLEKPVAMSVEDYKEMLEVAEQHNKLLMDGTMLVHHPRTQHFVQTVKTQAIMGTLKRIDSGFSFCGDTQFFGNNIRVKKDCDPLGCLGDLAWYVVRLALLAVGPDCPIKTAQVIDHQLNDDGVPIDATCLVHFQNDVILSFHCGFLSHFRQYFHAVGTKSGATMNDFVLPIAHPVQYQVDSMDLTEFDLITEHACRVEEFDGPVQEVLMWATFSRLAKAIDAKGWHGDSDDCRTALGLSHVTAANQQALDALMTSIRHGGAKVEVS